MLSLRGSGHTVLNLRTEDCDDAVLVDRSTIWGNPFVLGRDGDRREVIIKYINYFLSKPELYQNVGVLAGKNLACWCAPLPCHADFLLFYANVLGRLSRKKK